MQSGVRSSAGSTPCSYRPWPHSCIEEKSEWIALQSPVKVERAAGTRAGDNSDVRAMISAGGIRSSGRGRRLRTRIRSWARSRWPLLPPFTETPGMAGVPLVPVPAPPGPGYGEIPPFAMGSDPGPVPSLPAPEPGPENPCLGPSPRPTPPPPPDPPKPGLSLPVVDMAKAPLPPLPGNPTFIGADWKRPHRRRCRRYCWWERCGHAGVQRASQSYAAISSTLASQRTSAGDRWSRCYNRDPCPSLPPPIVALHPLPTGLLAGQPKCFPAH